MAAVAILIDGDNLSARHAARILQIAAARGRPTIQRAYLTARPALYELDPRGPEARVRLRQTKTAKAA